MRVRAKAFPKFFDQPKPFLDPEFLNINGIRAHFSNYTLISIREAVRNSASYDEMTCNADAQRHLRQTALWQQPKGRLGQVSAAVTG